jgi:DNA-binding NtrC family response regulator
MSALVVEDNVGLRQTLTEVVAERAAEVHACSSVAEVSALVTGSAGLRLDLVLLDFKLPDGTGLDVLTLLAQLPVQASVVAVSGEAGPEETFTLAQRGVRCFLRKPFRLEDVRAAIDEAVDTAPDLLPELRGNVGRRGIRDVEADVRRAMVAEALAKSGGSVRGAAALLGISRQHLQHILKAFAD